MLGWLPVAGASMPLFGSEDPLAPVGRARWHHRDLSEKAALAAGWSPGAAHELGWISAGVDLYLYHPGWILSGGPRRWRASRAARRSLGSIHFDDLPSTGAIEQVWQRLLGGSAVGLRFACEMEDIAAARHVIGAGLHAVQDFYSHSNWIDDPQRCGHTWLEAERPAPDGLWTGSFAVTEAGASPRPHGGISLTAGALVRIPASMLEPLIDRAGLRRLVPDRVIPRGVRHDRPAGINLDSRWQAAVGARERDLPGVSADEAFELALSLAERESLNWLRLLRDDALTDPALQDFWMEVATGPEIDWTDCFENASRHPYTFLTAGPYPPSCLCPEHLSDPACGATAEGRFLRVVFEGPRETRLRLRILDGTGRVLDVVDARPDCVMVRGPFGQDAAQVELSCSHPAQVTVHVFRRTPEPELNAVLLDHPIAGTPLVRPTSTVTI